MKLSKAYLHYQKKGTYAVCTDCCMAWEDDMPYNGVLLCPRCESEGRTPLALIRGIEILKGDTPVDKGAAVLRPTGKESVETIPLGEIMEKSKKMQADTTAAIENLKTETETEE